MNTTKKIKNIKLILTCFSLMTFACYFLLSSAVTTYSKGNEDKSIATRSSQVLPGILVLDDTEKPNSIFAGDKGKTPFDHNQHISKRADISCVTCHHTNSKNLTVALEDNVAKCSTCHLADDSPCQIEGTNEDKKFKGKTAINAKDAYHGNDNLVGCIGCHQERKIEPTSCKSCHTDSREVKYLIQPPFPSIKFEGRAKVGQINQINQINQIAITNPNPNSNSNPHWGNGYNHNSTPSSNSSPYYQNQHTERIIENTKEPNININNILPNTSSRQQNTQGELVRVINNGYLLEDDSPRRLKTVSYAPTIEEENEIASNKEPEAISHKLTETVSEVKQESFFDQALSMINKVGIILIIGLYIDIRRRMSS